MYQRFRALQPGAADVQVGDFIASIRGLKLQSHDEIVRLLKVMRDRKETPIMVDFIRKPRSMWDPKMIALIAGVLLNSMHTFFFHIQNFCT